MRLDKSALKTTQGPPSLHLLSTCCRAGPPHQLAQPWPKGALHHLEEEGESLSLPAFPAPSPGIHSDWSCFGHVFTSEPIPVARETEHTDWLSLNHRLQPSVPALEEKWERGDGCFWGSREPVSTPSVFGSVSAAAWSCDLGHPFPFLGSVDWSKCFKILT